MALNELRSGLGNLKVQIFASEMYIKAIKICQPKEMK